MSSKLLVSSNQGTLGSDPELWGTIRIILKIFPISLSARSGGDSSLNTTFSVTPHAFAPNYNTGHNSIFEMETKWFIKNLIGHFALAQYPRSSHPGLHPQSYNAAEQRKERNVHIAIVDTERLKNTVLSVPLTWPIFRSRAPEHVEFVRSIHFEYLIHGVVQGEAYKAVSLTALDSCGLSDYFSALKTKTAATRCIRELLLLKLPEPAMTLSGPEAETLFKIATLYGESFCAAFFVALTLAPYKGVKHVIPSPQMAPELAIKRHDGLSFTPSKLSQLCNVDNLPSRRIHNLFLSILRTTSAASPHLCTVFVYFFLTMADQTGLEFIAVVAVVTFASYSVSNSALFYFAATHTRRLSGPCYLERIRRSATHTPGERDFGPGCSGKRYSERRDYQERRYREHLATREAHEECNLRSDYFKICSHRLKQFYIDSNLEEKELKDELRLWHPNGARVNQVSGEYREKVLGMANEIVQVLQETLEDLGRMKNNLR
ncbi:unnamed protein product, partial [Aureobasidium pullulans]